MEFIPSKQKDNFELIDFDDIQKGQYISYYRKANTKYNDGKEQTQAKFMRGGYCSFVNSDKKFIGLMNFGRQWSVQDYNVEYWYIDRTKKERMGKTKSFENVNKPNSFNEEEDSKEFEKIKSQIIYDKIMELGGKDKINSMTPIEREKFKSDVALEVAQKRIEGLKKKLNQK